MDKRKINLYIQTYGMIFIGFIVLILNSFLEQHVTQSLSHRTQEIISYISLLISFLFHFICAVNIIRLRELPRPYMQSTTGVGAIIVGIMLLVLVTAVEISIIIELIKIL